MLFDLRTLDGLAAGSVTTTFRRWAAPRARAGSRFTTRAGVIEVGAVTALAIFIGAQTYGFGLFEMPPMDNRALLFRWISAIASSGILALFAGATAVLMWRIAYRRAP